MGLVRSVSQLPTAKNPVDSSFIEVSVPVDVDASGVRKYMSKHVSVGDLKSTVNRNMKDLLKESGSMQELSDFRDLSNTVQRIYKLDCKDGNAFQGEKVFKDKLTCPTTTTGESDLNNVVNVQAMKIFTEENSPLFIGADAVTDGKLTTSKEYNTAYRMIVQGRVSNEITCQTSGVFTCFGWLDEPENKRKNNATRWVSLEGNITTGDSNEWRILQLQPFIGNNFCSYVGFTFPVKRGLKLRISTGFVVGTNSNKYYNVEGSLTLNSPNTFVGSIYGAENR